MLSFKSTIFSIFWLLSSRFSTEFDVPVNSSFVAVANIAVWLTWFEMSAIVVVI